MFDELKKGGISGWLKLSINNQPFKKDMPPFRDSLLFLDDLVTKFRDCQRIIQGVADGSKNAVQELW